ncbi:MAG: kelch repeat-containing protein, partial [Xanthobacteraceae bacterium]
MKTNNRVHRSARRRDVAAIGGMLALLALLLPALPMPAISQSGQGAASAAASGETAGNGTWTFKAPLPAPRAEVAAVALDGKLHALGGAVSGAAGPYHDVYDPMTDSWQPGA